jgi:hypothetical protein
MLPQKTYTVDVTSINITDVLENHLNCIYAVKLTTYDYAKSKSTELLGTNLPEKDFINELKKSWYFLKIDAASLLLPKGVRIERIYRSEITDNKLLISLQETAFVSAHNFRVLKTKSGDYFITAEDCELIFNYILKNGL